jgi:hypothetical protein
MARHACIALILAGLAGCSCQPPPPPLPPPLKILFIGNSLTSTNNLPESLAAIALAERHPVKVDARLVGGWTLATQNDDPATNAAIARGGWDDVVLQEQSSTSVNAPAFFRSAAASLDVKIKAVGAHTLLYQNWPLKGEPERFDEYHAVFQSLADELGAQRVPAGDAWNLVRQDSVPGWEALYGDDRHPTPKGTYLTACVFYAVLFHAAPRRPDPVLGLSAADSAYFQAKAWASVQALSPTSAP